ncbi:putative pyrroloquinoline-quinone binding quinoprotein [Nocardiopsis sp. Huas11]|uniref:outer membrane protein assembly factor BamB family protein n=1 Tax=Nocardiopsis sp. Huas11 TaxID=2183912 RepID=UPI000F23BEFD|nr:putative pyrroloquinoline-quinone binding quinoprotein [Nocardiopsis sp. Huas11]
MVLGDGVVALDGSTGEELWHYRVESGGVGPVRSTPGGQEIMLTVPGDGVNAVVLLDAGTGELIAEHETAQEEGADRTTAVTSEVRVVPPAQSEGAVEAYSLLEGEPAWTYEPPEREGSAGVIVEDVFRAGETVVVTAAYNDGTEEGAAIDQGMLVVGLDGETGETLWEVEQEFTADMRRVPEYEVSPSEEVLFLGVGAEERHEFLLDPATGEEIAGEAYRDRGDRHPVGLLDDGYVDMAVDDDEPTAEYWYTSFQGEQMAHLEAPARPGEESLDPGLALEEGLLRLDYLSDLSRDRGPVDAEFVAWGSDETHVIPADLTANEEWWIQPEGSAMSDADAPVMVSVPGAIVVTEENNGPWTVVGLN